MCQSIPVNIGKITLACEFGDIGSVDYVGVNPNDARGSCMLNDDNKDCETQDSFKDLFANPDGNFEVINFSTTDLWGSKSVPSKCKADNAFVYAQYTCIQKEDDQHRKYFEMATTVALCSLIAYLFTISLRHLFQGGKIQQIEWDVATVTAGDYAVELKFEPEFYAAWKQQEYRKAGGDYEKGIAPAMSLTNYLTKEIEEELAEQHRRGDLT